MERRWFLGRLVLVGVALPFAVGGCQSSPSNGEVEASGEAARSSKTLVVATSANYPPYEQLTPGADSEQVVGFDIDLVALIAARLGREMSIVDMEFDEVIPALANDEADMAIAALEPTRSRRQQLDFSDIYYRSRQALISLDGYLDSRDLAYQTIAVRAGSVQARFADHLTEDYPDIDVVPYDTLNEVFDALDIGAVEAAILEASVAETRLADYPEFGMQVVSDDRPLGSAIAFPKNSPLRQRINEALADIESSGELRQLIEKWFS